MRDEASPHAAPCPHGPRSATRATRSLVSFGFPGGADIEDDEVKIRHRFCGWENFVFDTNSPFWGKSAGEV